jgi:hypothetical protein
VIKEDKAKRNNKRGVKEKGYGREKRKFTAEKMKREEERLMNKDEDRRKRKKRKEWEIEKELKLRE